MKKSAKKEKILPILAGFVLVAAVSVTLAPRLSGNNGAVPQESDALTHGGDLVIQTDELSTAASYFNYDVDGTTVQVFAVQASDGTVRLALNTCQVCNGSPYAYFEQDGDEFICQNCRNRFASIDIGRASGGCNPVPITEEIYTDQNGTITVPASFLEENAVRFTNWKNF